VAQWIARLPTEQEVVGSSPTVADSFLLLLYFDKSLDDRFLNAYFHNAFPMALLPVAALFYATRWHVGVARYHLVDSNGTHVKS
jgi:hypothetical protein